MCPSALPSAGGTSPSCSTPSSPPTPRGELLLAEAQLASTPGAQHASRRHRELLALLAVGVLPLSRGAVSCSSKLLAISEVSLVCYSRRACPALCGCPAEVWARDEGFQPAPVLFFLSMPRLAALLFFACTLGKEKKKKEKKESLNT